MKSSSLIFSTLAPMLLVTSAFASGTKTATLDITTNVVNSCTVKATEVAFGAYSGISQVDDDATGSVNVTCTTGTDYKIHLDNGQNAAGKQRAMSGQGKSLLKYSLFSDNKRTIDFVDSSKLTGTGDVQSTPVYGRIPKGQSVPAGNYKDAVTVSIIFD